MIDRPRAAVLVAAVSSAILTAGIPTATARSDREHTGSKSTGSGSHETAAAPSGTPSAGTQTPAGASSPTGPAPSTPERHSNHSTAVTPAKRGGGAGTGTTTTSSTSPPITTSTPGPAARHGGSAGASHHQDSGRGGRGQGGDQSSGASSGPRVSSGTPAKTGTGSTSTGPGGGAGGTAEGRRKQERSGKPKGSHVAQGKANKVESARPATLPSEPPSVAQQSSSAVAAPAVAAPATSAPVGTAVTATVAQPPVLTAGSAPAVARRFAQGYGAGKAHNQHRAGARRTGHGITASTAAAAIAGTASTAATSTSTTSSAHPKSLAKHGARPRSSSPLTSTITRIVDVVPTPIRVLIAALVALALAMAARTQLAARRARRLEQQRSELLEDVGLLQAALLPVTPARLGPVGTSTAYRPAAGPAAGGDFYDVFALEDGKLAVILGDVSGHGRKALPHTALVRFTLRAYLEAGLSPRGAVQTAGSVLERQLGGSFATVVAATYNPRERLLVYASAGHPPPLVRGREPGSKPLEPVTVSSSPPIGVGLGTGIRQSVIALPGAAQICFFTDGVTEARVGGDLYGIHRLDEALLAIGEQGTAAELLDRVSETADRRPDDMAACLLHVEGSSEAPVAVLEELELSREECLSERPEQFLQACGVPAEDAAQLMRSARLAAERSGSVVLELRRTAGAPEVSLQQDNLAYLQTRHAARQADLRMSI